MSEFELRSNSFGSLCSELVRNCPDEFAICQNSSGATVDGRRGNCNSSELVQTQLQSDRTGFIFFFQNTFNYTSASEQSPNSSARIFNLSEFIR